MWCTLCCFFPSLSLFDDCQEERAERAQVVNIAPKTISYKMLGGGGENHKGEILGGAGRNPILHHTPFLKALDQLAVANNSKKGMAFQ